MANLEEAAQEDGADNGRFGVELWALSAHPATCANGSFWHETHMSLAPRSSQDQPFVRTRRGSRSYSIQVSRLSRSEANVSKCGCVGLLGVRSFVGDRANRPRQVT